MSSLSHRLPTSPVRPTTRRPRNPDPSLLLVRQYGSSSPATATSKDSVLRANFQTRYKSSTHRQGRSQSLPTGSTIRMGSHSVLMARSPISPIRAGSMGLARSTLGYLVPCGFTLGEGTCAEGRRYAFDVVWPDETDLSAALPSLRDGRVFAFLDTGIPDGSKCCTLSLIRRLTTGSQM